MKKIYSCILISFCLLQFHFVSAQQKIKEGKITFTYTYPEKDKVSEDYFSQRYATGCTCYFKKGLTRFEIDDARKLVYLIHPNEQEIFLLNGKHAFKQSFDEARTSQAFVLGDTLPQITTDTKMIAGYKCTRALYTYPISDKSYTTIEIWFTRDIPAMNNDYNFRGIDGFILEYAATDLINYNGEEIEFPKIMTCTGIEKQNLSDDLFKLPVGMDVFTRSDVKKVEYH